MRFATAGLLVAGALSAWSMATEYRAGEAVASAWAVDHLVVAPVWAYPAQSLIFVGRPVRLGFQVTPECSSVIVAIMFLLGSALLAVIAPRFRLRRVLLALAIGTLVAIVVNLTRVVLIILASSRWGRGIGFGLGHDYVGSTLTVLGMACALLGYLWLLGRDRSPAGAK